jgi:hypothetical protein
MYLIKDGRARSTSSVYAKENTTIRTITNIYSKIGNKVILVWTAIKDYVSGVFGAGYWQNNELWNNKDMWQNKP